MKIRLSLLPYRRRVWGLIGVVPAVFIAASCAFALGHNGKVFGNRQLRTFSATSTLAVDASPPITVNGQSFLFGLISNARFVERVACSSASIRRISALAGVPTSEVLGLAGPVRVEQAPERSAGSKEQRSYGLLRQQRPYEVESDAYVADPLVRITVRGPDAKTTARLASVVPQAINEELRVLAGNKRAWITVDDRSGINVAQHGVPPIPAAVVMALVFWAFWAILGSLLRLDSTTRSVGS